MKINFQNQDITIYFAENLAYLLKKNHLSYKNFILELGYDVSHIYLVGKWVNGLDTPKLEDLIKTAIIFQISLEEMITVNLKLKDSIKH